MAQGLRERLIGAWKLVSYVEKPVDGSAPFYPMGEEPHGIIMYTPDGYMSAQLMHPGRPRFASGDWFRGSDEEVKEEAEDGAQQFATALRPLDLPALIVWGAHDPYIPVEFAERQREVFPHAEIKVLHGSGHWPFADDPDSVGQAVL